MDAKEYKIFLDSVNSIIVKIGGKILPDSEILGRQRFEILGQKNTFTGRIWEHRRGFNPTITGVFENIVPNLNKFNRKFNCHIGDGKDLRGCIYEADMYINAILNHVD